MIPQELKVLHTAIAAQVLQNYIVDMKSQNWFTGVFKNFVNNFLEQFRKLNTSVPLKQICPSCKQPCGPIFKCKSPKMARIKPCFRRSLVSLRKISARFGRWLAQSIVPFMMLCSKCPKITPIYSELFLRTKMV